MAEVDLSFPCANRLCSQAGTSHALFPDPPEPCGTEHRCALGSWLPRVCPKPLRYWLDSSMTCSASRSPPPDPEYHCSREARNQAHNHSGHWSCLRSDGFLIILKTRVPLPEPCAAFPTQSWGICGSCCLVSPSGDKCQGLQGPGTSTAAQAVC